MHIVHVISSLGYGGAEQLLYDTLAASDLTVNKHSVIYLRYGHHVENIEKLGVKTYSITGLLTRYDPVALLRLYKLMLRLKPDLIHSALWSANILSRLVAQKMHKPLINDLHGNCHRHGWFRNFLDRLTAHIPDAHIAVSAGVKESYWQAVVSKQLSSKKARSIFNRTHIIHNGISPKQLQLTAQRSSVHRRDFGVDETDFFICSVGRLKKIKGFDHLIESFAILFKRIMREHGNVRVRLHIIGSGPELQHLQAQTARLGIAGRVIFTPNCDARQLYHLHDCFVLASRSEGLSIALLEACSNGLAAVCSNEGKKHEVIIDGNNGMLVPVGDHQAMADALYTLYVDRKKAKHMGEQVRMRVEKEFSLDEMILKYHELYTKVITHY